MATYYRLGEGFLLRGWDRLPYTLVMPRTRRVELVSPDAMHILTRCDGQWDFDSRLTSDEDRRRVDGLLARGVVERCPRGEGIGLEQAYHLYPNRFMQIVHWSITGRCNYRCRHCFMSAPKGRYGELSHEATLDIARQIGACGIGRVSLTGGEPLIRPDFLDIAAELTRQGVTIAQLYTNGSLLDADVLDGLSELGQRPVVIVSFDGVGSHDWLRGVPGAERAADAAIRLCVERGFHVRAQMVLHRDNLDSLRTTVRHLADIGCRGLRVACVQATGEWLEHGRGLTPTDEEHLEVALRYIPEYYEDDMPLPLILAGLFAASPDSPGHYSVPTFRPHGDDPDQPLFACTRRTMQIYPNGRPAICGELGCDFVGMPPIVSDDPSQETMTLREVLTTGSAYMEHIDMRLECLLEANQECAACPYRRVCGGGCRASARRACGSILGKDPLACAFFKGGWARRLAETMREVRPEATCSLLDDPLFR